MLVQIRNIAIIALLALAITVLPAGDAAVNTFFAALSMAFLVVIALSVHRIYRQQQMTLLTLSDGRRAVLFGSVGVIAFLIVGLDEMLATGLGTLAWIALMALAVAGIFVVWRDASTYS